MDHHFIVDKSLYDIAATDLKEIWDADIDPHDFKIEDDWSPGSGMAGLSRSQVIIHDRLMSDAVLGGDSSPIKSEHSYCSQLSNSPTPPPINGLKDETEDDCLLPAVPTKPVRLVPNSVPFVVIKAEPMSEPSSPDSSCPSSPSPPPRSLKSLVSSSDAKINSDKFKESRYPSKQNSSVLTSKQVGIKRKHQMISTNVIKIEPTSTSSTRFPLPPTPPSCASSDNEGNVSPLHQSPPTRTLFLSASPTTTTRQPIQTPLISSQPKGSTGMLLLTEEEKRTLIAEGYPIPVRLPLTKAEEKCLKKIRRKIKNKISAQESRRKKKEYMDALERKVEILSSENADFKKKINTLEDMNTNLTSQVSKLQSIIARLTDEVVKLEKLESVRLQFRNV